MQDKQEKCDTRPIKSVTPDLPMTVEHNTSLKSQDDHQARVDANHGSLLIFFKPNKSKTERGNQCPNNLIQDEEQLSPLGPIMRGSRRPAERETEKKVINIGASIFKSKRDKLPDS